MVSAVTALKLLLGFRKHPFSKSLSLPLPTSSVNVVLSAFLVVVAMPSGRPKPIRVPTLDTIHQRDDNDNEDVAPDVIPSAAPRVASITSSKVSGGELPPNYVKFEVMLLYLRQQQLEKRWAIENNTTEGVILRRGKDDYISRPLELPKHVNGFYDGATKLNVKVCLLAISSKP